MTGRRSWSTIAIALGPLAAAGITGPALSPPYAAGATAQDASNRAGPTLSHISPRRK